MGKGWWELIFLMFLMKIPIVYLCAVVWWAIHAEPRPEEGAVVHASLPTEPPPDRLTPWQPRHRRPDNRPHGSPVRRSPRPAHLAHAEADRR